MIIKTIRKTTINFIHRISIGISIQLPNSRNQSNQIDVIMEGSTYNKETKESSSKNNMENKIRGKLDGGWGWIVCFCGFGCNVISFGIFMTFGIFLEPLMEHYKSSHR